MSKFAPVVKYQEIIPSENLKPYIKCFYIFESELDTEFEDTVFPSGLMEMIFNLGSGIWQTRVNNAYQTTPKIELWGQIIKPLNIRSKGRHAMLGIKFFPHTVAYFLNEEIGIYNNHVSDLSDVLDKSITQLHQRLLEANDLSRRIELLESYFLARLHTSTSPARKIQKVGQILSKLYNNEESISGIANEHDITPRYLHKLISHYTGLSPKLFNKINRFQQSLRLITHPDRHLTDIAYDCGYFDQSHFIKDFKSFTGVTPTTYLQNYFPVNNIFPL